MSDTPLPSRKAPARDEDLIWLFNCASAELGLASIHGALMASAVPSAARGQQSTAADATHVAGQLRVNWARERVVDRGIVRGRLESLPSHHPDAHPKVSRGESAVARHTRLMRAYGALGREDQAILWLAYGARPLGYQPVERVEEGARGVVMRSKLGRWSRVLAITSAMRASYSAGLRRIEKSNATQRMLIGPCGPMRATVPPSVDEWVEQLAAAKAAAPVLKDARDEAEQIVSAAWQAWNKLRGEQNPTPRRPRQPKGGAFVRGEEPLPWA